LVGLLQAIACFFVRFMACWCDNIGRRTCFSSLLLLSKEPPRVPGWDSNRGPNLRQAGVLTIEHVLDSAG